MVVYVAHLIFLFAFENVIDGDSLWIMAGCCNLSGTNLLSMLVCLLYIMT